MRLVVTNGGRSIRALVKMLLLVEGTPQDVGGRCNFVIDRRTVGLRIQCSECCTLQGDPELHVIQLMPFSSTPVERHFNTLYHPLQVVHFSESCFDSSFSLVLKNLGLRALSQISKKRQPLEQEGHGSALRASSSTLLFSTIEQASFWVSSSRSPLIMARFLIVMFPHGRHLFIH